ncbi:hypothetical protein Trydic_g10394 [Trypoxylus dichotomus]
MLFDEPKTNPMTISLQHLIRRYHQEVECFIENIITEDETGVYETKQLFMIRKSRASRYEEFKSQPFIHKTVVTMFRDSEA